MKSIKATLFLLAFAIAPIMSFAGNNTEKEQGQTIYLFGVGTAFGDTTVHFTSIIELDNVILEKKYKFLPMRSVYSLQLKTYLEGTLGLINQTCSIIFSDSKKKISKKYYKLKKAYLDNENTSLNIIGEDKFTFKKPDIQTN